MATKQLASKSLFLSFLVLSFILCSAVFSQADQQSSNLKQIDAKYVCMVTDKEFAREQIPVEAEGKTYYGCCEMCKAKIKNNPQSRVALDPVSGNQIDKSEAVIGSTPDGSVFYFESEENLAQYNPASGN